MSSVEPNPLPDNRPVVFVSSFYREREDYPTYRASPLWQLRQELAKLNSDATLRVTAGVPDSRPLTWVAEESEPGLSTAEHFAIVDRLVEVLRTSDIYLCILGDRRRGLDEHGSLVPVQQKDSAVSYFEVELYAAVMYEKPVLISVLDGFSPGPRLEALLQLLRFALPDWRTRRPQNARQIIQEVRNLISRQADRREANPPSLRDRLVQVFYRSRAARSAAAAIDSTFLFLNGVTENRPLPDKERVEELIREYRKSTNFQERLSRIWIAARELMPASYLPVDVQADARLKEFLPLWDSVLGDWVSAASWHGWHGHLYAGTVAPLHSQYLIRSQTCKENADGLTEPATPPYGGLASAYFSIARFLGFGLDHWRCLQRAGEYVALAIRSRKEPSDNLLAIRGSIRLSFGNLFGAIDDFKTMLSLRRASNASPERIADALMHLGQAYAVIPFKARKGCEILNESVKLLRTIPDSPNLPRALRKLALAYRNAGNLARAKELTEESEAAAVRVAAFDQMNR